MNDDSQEDKPTHSTLSRYRSPTFSKNEVETLLSLVEYHKGIILNKSTSTATCHAKECAWAEITKKFNSNGFKNERTVESLKVKWDNLKKVAKKMSKNLLDVTNNDFDDVTSRTVAMLCEAENINLNLGKTMETGDEVNIALEGQKQTLDLQNWNDAADQDSHVSDNDGDSENKRFLSRSINFSPQECNLLIQCVRQEKKFVLSKASTSGANKLKNRAWFRITNNYNKLSPQKRSTKMLRTKFSNMKKMAKSVSFKDYLKDVNRKHNKLIEDDKKIKSEPLYDYKDHSDADNDVDDSHNEVNEISNSTINLVPDPLSTTFNGDSGIDLINPLENKEIVRLKMDLLHYQMETAKLERRRIEEALHAQSLEHCLRLRAARLEAVAAAAKLPPAHAALAFTPDEARAQHLLAHAHCDTLNTLPRAPVPLGGGAML